MHPFLDSFQNLLYGEKHYGKGSYKSKLICMLGADSCIFIPENLLNLPTAKSSLVATVACLLCRKSSKPHETVLIRCHNPTRIDASVIRAPVTGQWDWKFILKWLVLFLIDILDSTTAGTLEKKWKRLDRKKNIESCSSLS